MRVGLFTYGMERELTGIGRYAYELSRTLQAEHPDVDVVLLNPYPRSRLAWYRRFPVIPVPSLARLPAVLTMGPAVLDWAARQGRVDVLHDPCGIAPFLWPRSRRYARVVTIHDAIPRLHPEWYGAVDRWLFKAWLPTARFTADAVMTVSTTAAHDLVRHLGLPGPRVWVTYSGVHVPDDADLRVLRRTRPLPFSPYFLFVGRVSRRKNLETVLEAFGDVAATDPTVHLVVAGPGALPGHRPAGPRIHVVGYVNDRDLKTLYARAAAVVIPSLYEGFGLPLLEGMAYGAPTISANAGSLPEIRGDAGLGIAPLDVSGWREAMLTLLRDEALRRVLFEKGRARARVFSWSGTARAVLAVYRTVYERMRGDRPGDDDRPDAS